MKVQTEVGCDSMSADSLKTLRTGLKWLPRPSSKKPPLCMKYTMIEAKMV